MSAYQRFAKGKLQAQRRPQRFKIHQPQFDSQNSSRSDIPNIYIPDNSEVDIPEIPMWQKKKKPSDSMQESVQQLQIKKEVSVPSPERSPKKRMEIIQASLQESHNQPSYQHDSQPQEIFQPEIQIQPHTSLSLFQIVKLYLGEYLFRNPFPMRKLIYINNNNQDENEINKKQFQIKFKNQEKEIMHFDNSITVGNGLFLGVLMLRNVFSYFYVYAWVAVVVMQFIAEGTFLKGPIQYGTNKVGVIVILIVAIILQLVADVFAVRKRRNWAQNTNFYKVYHHNGRNAEWVNVKANEIKPGHIYTVVPGECLPTDCVLIHAEHSMIQIKEKHLLSCLVEPPSEIVLKEALIKAKNVNLPFSGFFSYEISSPEYSSYQITGKLNLQEPNQASHPVSMAQIILRGSINCSDTEILCLAMQTGIDSLFLKNLQYPYQHRKSYQESPQAKSKIISDDVSFDIRDHENTLIGVPMQKKIYSIVYSLLFMYLFITGVGVLTNFLYKLTTHNEFYLTQTSLSVANVVIYHFTNFIIFIPVLLIPIFRLFVLFSGSITETNVSKRPLDLIPDTDKYKRTTTLQGFYRGNNDDLLDNKKIIFPIKIKDHNILHELCDIDTIITTIDTFRDESAFILHSIKVKQLSHNFSNPNSDMYSIQDQEEIKRFMSFALLTTSKSQFDESISYEDGIQQTAKKYLELKRVKNAYGEIQINNNEDTKVKHILSIKPTSEYPYKVTFLEPVVENADENPDILVLIRGDPKTILDKAYGKDIALTVESRRLHEEKDFYVELMAKTTMRLSDALQIQRAYNSNSIEKNFFYKNLDKYISKVQPMGLLIYVNNFFQKKIGQTVKNPVLNKSLLNQSKYPKVQTYDSDIYDSQHMPNLIILTPASKSSTPQFESLHTIKNILMNSYLFNFTLAEVSEKILQDKPSSLQKMMKKLEAERVLVWDNWDQKDITYTLDIMKKYGKKILFYIEKDEYMYLMKETDCSVYGGKQGYDAPKYSDITLTSRSSVSYFYLTQLIRYDSVVIKQGLLSIFFTQFSKYIFYLVIEFINLFYTRGTGLAVIRTPLYLVVEATLLLDVFYYLNWKDSMRGETFNRRERFTTEMFIRMLHALFQGLFITFICLYSLQTPPDSTGTPQSYHFTYFAIVYTFLHVLVFQKIFNILTSAFSIYKLIIIAVQLLTLYIGFIIVSVTDTYGYYGILWNALVGKVFLTTVILIWICLSLPAIRLLLQLMKGKRLKRADKSKKAF